MVIVNMENITIGTVVFTLCCGSLTACGVLIVNIVSDIRDQIKNLHDRADNHETRLTKVETTCTIKHGVAS